jgi:hypothetical protein
LATFRSSSPKTDIKKAVIETHKGTLNLRFISRFTDRRIAKYPIAPASPHTAAETAWLVYRPDLA